MKKNNTITHLKLIYFFISGLLLISIIGCPTVYESDKKVVIRYWTGWSGHELDVQKKIIKRFNETHPNIDVHITSVAASYEKVKISFAAGNPPDVCSAIWAEELAGYAMRGALTPLDDYLKTSRRHPDEYMPGIWNMFQYGGHTWALNVTTNATFLLYNKNMFKKAGLDPDHPPITINQFDKSNEKLAKFDKNGNVLQFGHRPSGLVFWSYVFGGKWYDPETRKVTANDPHNVKTLEWLQSYGEKYNLRQIDAFNAVFASGTYHDEYAGLYGLFFGKVAMLISGEYSLGHIQRYAPKDFEYGYFAAPAPFDGRPDTVTVGGSVFVIPKDSKHKKEAWIFLDWMTQPEQVREFCDEIKNIPPLIKIAHEPLFMDIPMFRFSVDLVSGENAFGPPQMPTWPYYQNEITRVEEKAVFGKEDPKKLLDELNIKIQKDLDEALRDAAY